MPESNEPVPHAYIEKGKKLESITSAAWVFTLAGSAGILALLVSWLNTADRGLPLSGAVFRSIVLGCLFLFFLLTGIHSFRERKKILREKAMEDTLICQIIQWFKDHYSADAISNGMEEDDLSIEELYFLRSENISRAMG